MTYTHITSYITYTHITYTHIICTHIIYTHQVQMLLSHPWPAAGGAIGAAAKAKMVKGLFAKKKLKVVHTPWHSPFGSHFPDPRLKSSQSFYNEDSEEADKDKDKDKDTHRDTDTDKDTDKDTDEDTNKGKDTDKDTLEGTGKGHPVPVRRIDVVGGEEDATTTDMSMTRIFAGLSPDDLQRRIEETFGQFDIDNSGYLDFEEFARAFDELGAQGGMSQEHVREMFDQNDADASGLIDLEEFANLVRVSLARARPEVNAADRTKLEELALSLLADKIVAIPRLKWDVDSADQREADAIRRIGTIFGAYQVECWFWELMV